MPAFQCCQIIIACESGFAKAKNLLSCKFCWQCVHLAGLVKSVDIYCRIFVQDKQNEMAKLLETSSETQQASEGDHMTSHISKEEIQPKLMEQTLSRPLSTRCVFFLTSVVSRASVFRLMSEDPQPYPSLVNPWDKLGSGKSLVESCQAWSS